jgi:hypothetical protein
VACGRHLWSVADCRSVVDRLTEVRERGVRNHVACGGVFCRCVVTAAGHKKREAAIVACGGHQRRPCAASLYKMYEKYRKYAGGVVLWLWPVACGPLVIIDQQSVGKRSLHLMDTVD